MQCDYFDAGVCRSCTFIEVPYPAQVARKVAGVREILDPVFTARAADPDTIWRDPAISPEAGFRNKAKMVVTGHWSEPKLGILDPNQHPKHHDGTGVDLSECPLYEPGIISALGPIAETITEAQLVPYNVGTRTGELKHVIITISPQQELMIRFVLRSTEQLTPLRNSIKTLRAKLAALQTPATVVSANLLPQHQALLEGPEEIPLAGDDTLTMLLNGVPLRLRPQGFFQTNTLIAAELYSQAARWVDELPSPITSVWDLYAGVGGFGFTLAQIHSGPHRGTSAGINGTDQRLVWGTETSAQAIDAATLTVADLGLEDTVKFVTGDATEIAAINPANVPELIIVNPPRRGIGEDLATWINSVAGTEPGQVHYLLYSSCNAKTLATDLEHLNRFTPLKARMLDMFPHTNHSETLVLLEAMPAA